MKIAITGGTGFVGRHLARELSSQGHEVVLVARGLDRRDETIRATPGVSLAVASLDDAEALARAFAGCTAVAHCAGINRQLGAQTYQRVHIDGTRAVLDAARRASVQKIALLSFSRARPGSGHAYHESKWHAEELVRNSGLDFTVLKAGVIYGKGDHLLDHLSHTFHTFPFFGLVGFAERLVAPVAVEDVVAILRASLVEGALSRQTVAVTGPETITCREAVERVARAVGKRPWFVRLPVVVHIALAWFWERVMVIPLVAIAQVKILAEGAAEPAPGGAELPPALTPRIAFSRSQIQRGLPRAGAFGPNDLRCCSAFST